jgi:hypothetical protein
MGRSGAGESPAPADDEELHEVVPARAVLTELARGFLLVRENDRDRAVRFAMTFLKERSDRPATPASSTTPSPGQRVLGRYPRGAVERLDWRALR